MAKRNRKKDSQYIHACNRAVERLGFLPDFKEIVKKIQSGKASFYRRDSDRITLWLMTFAEKDMVVVYDSKRHSVVTFLYPKEAVNPGTIFM